MKPKDVHKTAVTLDDHKFLISTIFNKPKGEFNQGVLLRAALDPVVLTDFDKVLAGQARNPERFYIVGGFHHGELVVGAVDKPVETVARLCG